MLSSTVHVEDIITMDHSLYGLSRVERQQQDSKANKADSGSKASYHLICSPARGELWNSRGKEESGRDEDDLQQVSDSPLYI